jgi:hypothetical protein
MASQQEESDNQAYLQTKVNHVLEPVIFQMQKEKPQNPAKYMMDYFVKTYGEETTSKFLLKLIIL